jgi:hypothetical protein
MSTIFTDGFEAGFGSWTDSGTTANTTDDTSIAKSGTHSLLVSCPSAAQAWLARTITGSTTHVVRFYVRIATTLSGTTVIYQASNAQGDMRIRLTSGRIVQACINNTAVSGPTLNLSQWYRIDARFLTATSTATIDWQVDGSAQTQATLSQASANMTSANLGIITSRTGALNFDDILADNSSSTYPLGADGIAYAIVSSGTGAVNQSGAGVKATAGRPTGTGMTWVGITGDLVVAPATAPGVYDPINSLPIIDVEPDADPASGTGAGYNAGKTASLNSLSTGAGTGAAYGATVQPMIVSEISSGLGAAAAATQSVAASIQASTGTGAAANATPAVSVATAPGLTLQMGI